MSKLYSDLAEVYEAMYATFINYQEEYEFYSKLIKRYDKKSLLEIGCGTGSLSSYFIAGGFEYYGLDLSQEMLAIAKNKNPENNYIQGDMRAFKLDKVVESAIMTGRTISYLLTNEDVNSTLKSIHDNLETGGIFCFDFIDANTFIPAIAENPEVVHEASHKNLDYVRKGKWTPKLKQGMDCVWEASYYKKSGENLIEIGKDISTVRTFTKNEMEIFFQINNFEVKEIFKRASYAFPTYVMLVQKQ